MTTWSKLFAGEVCECGERGTRVVSQEGKIIAWICEKCHVKEGIKLASEKRKEYISEYERLAEILNNRVSSGPSRNPFKIAREIVEVLGAIEGIEALIKKYEKDLEEL